MTVPESLVSIVIPVYNGANYLREAVDSALAQTWPLCEVLVINDGSADGGATESIALSYGDRIRYFHKENGGVASALNLGIKEMRGDFFSWLSHDDVYLPDKCRVQVELWRQGGETSVILYADAAIIDAHGKTTGTHLMPDMRKDEALFRIWGSSFLNGCTMLIPRLLLLEAGGFNEALPTTQDYDLWLRLAQRSTFRLCPGVVLLSRQHAAQGSRSRAHRRECAELFSRYVPQLLQQARKLDGGFAGAAPLLARGMAQRAGDYGITAAGYIGVAFMENARHEEKRQLVPLLVRHLPYVCLRWAWQCLPACFRTHLRGLYAKNARATGRFRAALRDGGWRPAVAKVIRYIRRVSDRARRVMLAAPACARRLPQPGNRPLQVVIDHDAGGGANAFREQYVSRLLEQGDGVLIWQYLVGRYFFEWRSSRLCKTFRASNLERATAFVQAAAPHVVFFNNMAGWPHLPETLEALSRLKLTGAKLHVFLHDFFVLCPAYPLLNRDGTFCGLPMPPVSCRQCLPGHPLAAAHDEMDIAAWRNMWSRFLLQADSLRVADGSVRDMIARVYPQLAERILITPLEPLQRWNPLPSPPLQAPIVVGVIGYIVRNKGAGIVEDLLRLISAKGLDARVVVIGFLESSLRHPRLHVTGPYVHSQLPSLLQKHGVTMGLVPSPLPETFCYVSQEIEMLGLPLICLDLGAQGVRAHRYSKGFPAPTPDAAGCLEAILQAAGRTSQPSVYREAPT